MRIAFRLSQPTLSADEALVVLGLFEIGVVVHAHMQVMLLAQLVQNVVFGLAFVLHCEPLLRSSQECRLSREACSNQPSRESSGTLRARTPYLSHGGAIPLVYNGVHDMSGYVRKW